MKDKQTYITPTEILSEDGALVTWLDMREYRGKGKPSKITEPAFRISAKTNAIRFFNVPTKYLKLGIDAEYLYLQFVDEKTPNRIKLQMTDKHTSGTMIISAISALKKFFVSKNFEPGEIHILQPEPILTNGFKIKLPLDQPND